jgi:endonuclease/exonuclease/phosphatase family metal-dependent hydrolase
MRSQPAVRQSRAIALPVRSSEVVALPTAGKSQGRSALRLLFDRGGGKTLQVPATHLQHRNDAHSMHTRLDGSPSF